MYFKVLLMSTNSDPLHQISDIKQMMERSSRFMSLSGLSGVVIGVFGILAAWLMHREISNDQAGIQSAADFMQSPLFSISIITLIVSLVVVGALTWRKSKKMNLPVWGPSSQRMVIHLFIPILVGGLFIIKLLDQGLLSMAIAACLIFYGLGQLNASKYTLGDIRYLGYTEIFLGILQLYIPQYGFIIWGLGFGLAHIIYGTLLWNKYER